MSNLLCICLTVVPEALRFPCYFLNAQHNIPGVGGSKTQYLSLLIINYVV